MFQIISDGGCDFTQAEIKQYQIDVIPFYVSFDEIFLKVGTDITTEEFFNRLAGEKGLFPKTSQPNPNDYVDVCEKHLKEGKDLIILTISSKLSGSNNSANVAADILREEYPDRKIVVIDSLNATIGQGLILKEMLAMQKDGISMDEVVSITDKLIDSAHIYFTLDTLEYLKRGGRVGPTTAFVGNILGLRPILQVKDGEVKSLDNVRGKKNAIRLIKEGLVAALSDEKENIQLVVAHIFSEKDAVNFKSEIEDALGMKINNDITEVGAIIGAHAGPGALAFAYCKKYQQLRGEN